MDLVVGCLSDGNAETYSYRSVSLTDMKQERKPECICKSRA